MNTRIVAAAVLTLSAAGAESQQLPEWRLSATPQLTLSDNGTSAKEFHRIAGAWRLSGGNIVVANGATNQLRVFDGAGALVESFGRTGKGPGEFESISIVHIGGDTAVVYDFRSRRATTIAFSPKAKLVETLTFTVTGATSYSITGRLPDGRWVLTWGMGSPGGWDAPKGVSRVKGTVGLVAPDGGGTIAPVAEVLSMASITYMPSTDKGFWGTGPAAFSPWYQGRVSGGALWFGESGSDSLVRLDVRGNRRRILLPMTAMPVSAQVLDAAGRPELEMARKSGRPGYAEFRWSKENLPDRLPFFGELLAGVDGELWVQEYSPVSTTPRRYLVLNSEGRPVASVTVPAGLRVTHAGRDFVVVLTRDADDLEGVKVFRLTRSAR
jgi:hypothetical protein